MKDKKNINIVIVTIIIIIVGSLIPAGICLFKDNIQLKMLSYSNKSIKKIRQYDLIKYVIKKNKYSATFNKAIMSDDFIVKNKDIYYSLNYVNKDNYIRNINTLSNIGYKGLQLKLIFKYLSDDKIENLEKFNYVEDINKYVVYDYMKPENINRYINYGKKNTNLKLGDIITQININLDYPQYTNIKNIDNPSSTTVLVNKYNKLSSNFTPNDLTNIDSAFAEKGIQLVDYVNTAFYKMCTAASKESLSIKAVSGYRSYTYQTSLYNNYVNKDGRAKADTYSARPGHSEHQTGLVADVSGGGKQFEQFKDSDEYEWLKLNAHKYGFIIRYPLGMENITLYQHESWHLRYVGVDIATFIFNKNITFDEYYIRYLDK